MKDLPMAVVEWIDSASSSGWRQGHETEEPLRVVSCGYLLHECKRKVILIQSMAENGDMADSTVIPRSCVQRIRRIK